MKFSKMSATQLFDAFERKIYDDAALEDPFSNQEPTTISTYEVIVDGKKMYYAGIDGCLDCISICFNATVDDLLTSDRHYTVSQFDAKYEGVLVQLIKAPKATFAAF